MLDRFLPEPRFVEVDHVDVAAPPDKAYAAARHFDLARSSFIRGLFVLRTLPERLTRLDPSWPLVLRLDDIGRGPEPGFRLLADEPGIGFAIGAIGRFWETEIPFADVTPETFADFDEPGFGKVAWAILFRPWGDGGTRITFELRVSATSDEAWSKQRRYFRLIGPFSHFIRRDALALLAQDLGGFEASEQTRPLPGDDFVPIAKAQATHGITIDAPPERIWPWLLQLGCRRGGWYSYDLLDNAGFPSARELFPELLHLRVGDVLAATPQGEDGFTVLRVAPPHALILGGTFDLDAGRSVSATAPLPARYWRVSWAFVLEPLDGKTTRLHVRARVDYAPESVHFRALFMRFIHHFMQAEQLRNLKRRAEGRRSRTEEGLHEVGEGIVGAMGMLASLATPFLRKQRAHWGLDEATVARPYPGDELVPEPTWSWTHGVEIDAPPEEVWPWVVQIGQDKAGFYSYEWLENLVGCDLKNAERVHPEWQELRPGDSLRLHKESAALSIAAVEPGHYFLAHGETDPRTGGPVNPDAKERAVRVSWLFYIEPIDEKRSRFISRYRAACGVDWRARILFGPLLMEPIGFVMDRRMLLGVKERAELFATPGAQEAKGSA
jgi:hypothetical protein